MASAIESGEVPPSKMSSKENSDSSFAPGIIRPSTENATAPGVSAPRQNPSPDRLSASGPQGW
jgi:hypothetical protein